MQSDELEGRAVALVQKYGPFLPGPAKAFFRDLAEFLNWTKLKEHIK